MAAASVTRAATIMSRLATNGGNGNGNGIHGAASMSIGSTVVGAVAPTAVADPTTDELTGLLVPSAWSRDRSPTRTLGSSATTGRRRSSSIELEGLDRLVERLGPRRRSSGSCPPWPTRSAAAPARPTTSRASAPAGSPSCCPRPTRSSRSTTSSASGGPASCGSSPARSRFVSPSAGPARPATAARRRRGGSRRTGCTSSSDAGAVELAPTRPRGGRSAARERRHGSGLRHSPVSVSPGRGGCRGPGVAPVCAPPSTTSDAVDDHVLDAVGNWRGSS